MKQMIIEAFITKDTLRLLIYFFEIKQCHISLQPTCYYQNLARYSSIYYQL
ncbi:BAF_HP2_G0010250.mRNA.1.CDS.1 [Saccharomyces cerevisiae]|nr:BAF_HP2_G0010250.mRNA.1.CDS.1 [Saccharomyces cerevisiae]CAI6433779.1 BAF_HP1_G0010710.mRNA.1.CDS.1 [Saccharomyces cerevisiae]CAI6436911.1 BAF_HP2_G0010250.mRNA.1.CDS.1 [Saccharomyces cerevisiae]